jgi:hypothetical protein
MAKLPSPIHTKRVPRSVSKPTTTAEAAATVAEAAVAPPAKRSRKTPKAAIKVAAPAAAPAAVAKPAKAHKPKLVRDSFTMPKDEYQAIDVLKGRALALEKHVRKSELLRAGIQALSAMNDRAFLKAITAVPTLKTGRPKSA